MWSLGLWNPLASGKPRNWGKWGLIRNEATTMEDSKTRLGTEEGLEEQEQRSPHTGKLRRREFGLSQQSDKEVV